MDSENSKLKEIDKTKNPFKVPENYFAQFNEEIMNRLPEKETIVPKPVPMWDRVKPWVYMAAMFFGLYFTINFLRGDFGNDRLPGKLNTVQQTLPGSTIRVDNNWSNVQVTEEEFIQYLEDQLISDNYFDFMYHQLNLN